MYVGVGLLGGLGSFLVRGVTDRYGFQTALFVMGGLLFITWPLTIFFIRDKPSEVGQFPDGLSQPSAELGQPPQSYASLLKSGSFWLLLFGSICSIGSIGCINVHMKFVFRDDGYRNQLLLDAAWTRASVLVLWSSVIGRVSIGHLADLFSKKIVMTSTYFVVAFAILLLLRVSPAHPAALSVFAVVFGFAMGADYMLIPLMAAEQFGVNTLARAMAIILPLNTIGQTWGPYLVSALREHYGNYLAPLALVFAVSILGAGAVSIIPRTRLSAD
jgi:MFS family permease